MTTFEDLQKEIDEIKARNKRVEADKAWEVSFSRKLIIFALTYLVIVLFFVFAKLPDPFKNAVVPAVGFMLSTLSMPLFKRVWMKTVYRK